MRPVTGNGRRTVKEVADTYRWFGEREARGVSPTFEAWVLGVAEDTEVLAQVVTLPTGKQQPNLVFAAVRWLQPGARSFEELREVVLTRTGAWRQVVTDRATQTNEAARCALHLPVLAQLPEPIALIELGTSAGLCLLPDRWSYRYRGDLTADLDPPDGPSPVVLECDTTGPVPRPRHLPRVMSRTGVDLHPLDVHDDDAMAWLETLTWPEHEERRRRLQAAVAVARSAAEPPVRLLTGGLNDRVRELVEAVSEDVTPVVLHTAVLAYLDEEDRDRFVQTITGLRCRWLSVEGRAVLPIELPESVPSTAFTVALDGHALAVASGHGHRLTWLG